MSTLKQPLSEQDHRRGSDNAPAVLVEYGDFECPFCGRAQGLIRQLQDRFGSQLLFVFRHFPLSTVHPHAELAAEAAEAAGTQGRFWEMHDALYDNQEQLSAELIVGLGQTLELNMPRFMSELNGRSYRARVQQDFMGGVRSGVNGTPTFFINGLRHDGPVDLDSLSTALELAARAARRAPKPAVQARR